MKFYENPSSGSHVVTRGRRDGQYEANRRFRNFANALITSSQFQVMFRSLYSVYCLCVNVYCTAVYCLCVNMYCTAVLFVCKCVLYCCVPFVCKCVLYYCVLFVCKCVLYCCVLFVCKCVLYCCSVCV
jgi:hypothetical protein